MSKEMPFIQSFDPVRKLQYINTDPSVMHCHHYSAIFTKLALEFESMGGARYMAESMEEAAYVALKKIILTENIASIEDRTRVAEEYYRLTGLGELVIGRSTAQGGQAEIKHSHIDQGWVKKYGTSKVPINFVTCGFLAGTFSIIHGKHVRHYEVIETSGAATGAAVGKFTIKERA